MVRISDHLLTVKSTKVCSTSKIFATCSRQMLHSSFGYRIYLIYIREADIIISTPAVVNEWSGEDRLSVKEPAEMAEFNSSRFKMSCCRGDSLRFRWQSFGCLKQDISEGTTASIQEKFTYDPFLILKFFSFGMK